MLLCIYSSGEEEGNRLQHFESIDNIVSAVSVIIMMTGK
jgi:hypothetical protein